MFHSLVISDQYAARTQETMWIEPAAVSSILRSGTGVRIFSQALQSAVCSDDLLRILGLYIHFNSVFAAGVASLAGQLAARYDLFRDPDDEVKALADRSVEVAACIFHAGKEEFGEPGMSNGGTHRSLAQSTIKAAADFFHGDRNLVNSLLAPNDATLAAIEKVRDGYGNSRILSENELFQAIGFHLSSETLAQSEFEILDSFLEINHSDLVVYLKGAKIKTHGVDCPAYLWIGSHAKFEAEHSRAAWMGASNALKYYAGTHSTDRLKQWIVEGFEKFAAVQTEFMTGLLRSIN